MSVSSVTYISGTTSGYKPTIQYTAGYKPTIQYIVGYKTYTAVNSSRCEEWTEDKTSHYNPPYYTTTGTGSYRTYSVSYDPVKKIPRKPLRMIRIREDAQKS